MATNDDGSIRYNVKLPGGVGTDLNAYAKKNHLTVTAVLIKFIRLGLILLDLQDAGGKVIIQRPGEEDERLVIL